jgi:hypothetical protein
MTLPSTASVPSAASTISGVTELTHLGVIRVTGDDAVTFLQGQLTQDVALMGAGDARLAAFCNAKGRMQASFVVFKRAEDVLAGLQPRHPARHAQAPVDVCAARQSQTERRQRGVRLVRPAGSAIESIAGTPRSVWAKADIDAANVVFLHPGAGQPLALWCAPAASPAPEGPRITSPNGSGWACSPASR